MKKILTVIGSASLLAVACNNQSSSTSASDSTSTTSDTVSKTDSAAFVTAVDSLQPTANELQDDSVFTDGSTPSSWANAGFNHPEAFKQFLKRFQSWVATDNKDSIASVIAYPLKNPKVKDKAAFIAGYDRYMSANIKAAVKQQNLRQIFRNGQGAMIGDGKIWFNETADGYRIIGINQ